eukprot:Skav224330  [mRNA]  locus=scaffold1353:184479:198564:- [translate_table: standard]
MRPALCHGASFWRVPATAYWLRPSPRGLACRVPRVCLAAKSGGRVAGPRSRGRGSNPMDWAKESRMARWRRRAAATVLAMVVLLGAMGGAVSSGRAKVYKSDTPFRQAERLLKSHGATVLNRRLRSPNEDTAGVLSPTAVREIDALATDLQRKPLGCATGSELVVVTVPGVHGADQDRTAVKRFATQLFNSWGLGDRPWEWVLQRCFHEYGSLLSQQLASARLGPLARQWPGSTGPRHVAGPWAPAASTAVLLRRQDGALAPSGGGGIGRGAKSSVDAAALAVKSFGPLLVPRRTTLRVFARLDGRLEGVRTLGGPQRMGGAVRRSREVSITAPEEGLEQERSLESTLEEIDAKAGCGTGGPIGAWEVPLGGRCQVNRAAGLVGSRAAAAPRGRRPRTQGEHSGERSGERSPKAKDSEAKRVESSPRQASALRKGVQEHLKMGEKQFVRACEAAAHRFFMAAIAMDRRSVGLYGIGTCWNRGGHISFHDIDPAAASLLADFKVPPGWRVPKLGRGAQPELRAAQSIAGPDCLAHLGPDPAGEPDGFAAMARLVSMNVVALCLSGPWGRLVGAEPICSEDSSLLQRSPVKMTAMTAPFSKTLTEALTGRSSLLQLHPASVVEGVDFTLILLLIILILIYCIMRLTAAKEAAVARDRRAGAARSPGPARSAGPAASQPASQPASSVAVDADAESTKQ